MVLAIDILLVLRDGVRYREGQRNEVAYSDASFDDCCDVGLRHRHRRPPALDSTEPADDGSLCYRILHRRRCVRREPFGKWYWFVHDVLECHRERKANWLGNWEHYRDELKANIAQYEIDGTAQRLPGKYQSTLQALAAWTNCGGQMTAELLPYWRDYEKAQRFVDSFGQSWAITKPLLRDHKSRIVSWIVYWPPVLFWSLLNDPLRRIGRCLYNMMQGIMQRTIDSAWKDEDNIYVPAAAEATKTASDGNP